MSHDTERRLHDQLLALGTIEPSPGLADAALRQAKQRRRRGILAAAGAAVLVIAIVVPLSLRHSAPQPAQPGPAQRNVIVAYQTTPKNTKSIIQNTLVLDPKTGKYIEPKLPDAVRHASALPLSPDLAISPDGQHYATSNGKYVFGLSDAISGKVAGFKRLDPGRTSEHTVSWSADSSRLLIPIQGVGHQQGFRIYDVRTGNLGKLVHLPVKSTEIDSMDLAWTENDTMIVSFTGDSAHPKVEFFTLDGRLQRSVSIPAKFLAMISPDGRYLSLDNGLFDLQTGRQVKLQVPTQHQVTPPEPIGWLDDEHYAMETVTSSGDDVRLLVLTTSGKLVKSIKPPRGTPAMPKTATKSTWNVVSIFLGYGAHYPPSSGLRL